MESTPFIIERRLLYHGIWNAGYNIGELFIKNVSKEFPSKPPYPALLRLSSGSLALTVFQRGSNTPVEIRTDAIPFDALREISVNPFNSRCLMIFYVNNKNKFSALINSCKDALETQDIATAFQRLRNIRKMKTQTPKSSNWIIRKDDNKNVSVNDTDNNNTTNSQVDKSLSNVSNDNKNDDIFNGNHDEVNRNDEDNASIKSRTDSTVIRDNFDFLDCEQDMPFDMGAVFEEQAFTVDREQGPSKNKCSVGLQTSMLDRFDRMSVSSRTSTVVTFRADVEDVSLEPSVAGEEYFKLVRKSLDHRGINGQSSNKSPKVDGPIKETEYVQTENASDSDYRSIAVQVNPRFLKVRYTKRVGSTSSSTNSYKAMAAQRKQKNANGDGSCDAYSTPTSSISGNTSQIMNGFHSSNSNPNHKFGQVKGVMPPHQPVFVSPRAMGLPSTTVSRSIEHVYNSQSWSRRGSSGHTRKRRVLVVTSARNSVRF